MEGQGQRIKSDEGAAGDLSVRVEQQPLEIGIVVVTDLATSFQTSLGLGITFDKAECDAAHHGKILS